ncbi:alpha/beta hydrolase [Vibrio neonatus]|uniref:alpha/beta hydrolase n=1 Tax=Vibrio neonatus TaxID=278860 RepID=UPI0021C33A44|nr:lysophospholipase [Vibrio neonatus]
MSKKLILFLIMSLITTIVITVIVSLNIGQKQFQESTFAVSPLGSATPTDVGIQYEDIDIEANDRVLKAWYVPAKDAMGAVLVFHGQNESLSNWVWAIQRLHQRGLSVFVFDYSGFGQSQGKPSVEALREDALAAYTQFKARIGNTASYFLGYSLGTGVLIDALSHHQQMTANGVVLASPLSSIRDVAIESGSVLPIFSFVVPDAYNNVTGVTSITMPVSIVHSETDGRFPVWMAQKVAKAAANANLTVVSTPKHSEFLASPEQLNGAGVQFWNAVLGAMTSD